MTLKIKVIKFVLDSGSNGKLLRCFKSSTLIGTLLCEGNFSSAYRTTRISRKDTTTL
jgi:hypothetical protein